MSADAPHTSDAPHSSDLENSHEEYESIPSAGSFSFGFLVIGFAVAVAVIAVGGMWTRFPVVRKPPVWAGIGTALVLMVAAFRTFLFGRFHLQIGKDRLRILNPSGVVTDDIPYSAIAEVKLIRQTVIGDAEGNPLEQFGGGGLLGRSWRELTRAPDIAFASTQHHILGLRFHDTDTGTLDRQELAARARKRGNFSGCDWVLPSDAFAAPIGVIAQLVHERWLAYHEARAPSAATAPASAQ
jgi:hypothetical protein